MVKVEEESGVERGGEWCRNRKEWCRKRKRVEQKEEENRVESGI